MELVGGQTEGATAKLPPRRSSPGLLLQRICKRDAAMTPPPAIVPARSTYLIDDTRGSKKNNEKYNADENNKNAMNNNRRRGGRPTPIAESRLQWICNESAIRAAVPRARPGQIEADVARMEGRDSAP
jgi:hypothetical protein